ncbi:apelin receptor A-like [Amia ocellicauda]|uniref:apelin receptor A-like n=1 Tax=Amia ocellicauda TaxID=2972642 RepID=UPI0034646A97
MANSTTNETFLISDEPTNYSDFDFDFDIPAENITGNDEFVMFIIVIYCFVFFIGTVGNIAIIYTMAMKKTKKRLADIFITHLSVADLVFLITLPLWIVSLALNNHWPFGVFLCQFTSYILSVNMFSSIFFLTSMSIDRYMAIVLLSDTRTLRTKRYAHLTAGVVWGVSFGLGIQSFFFRTVDDNNRCTDSQSEQKHVFSLVSRVLAFLLPLLTISICYSSIAIKLHRHFKRMNKEEKYKRRSVKLGLWIIAMFIVSWLPFNILATVRTLFDSQHIDLSSEEINRLQKSLMFATCLAFSNSCVNPIIYIILDSYVQKCIFKLLHCSLTHTMASMKSSMTSSTVYAERDSISSKELS